MNFTQALRDCCDDLICELDDRYRATIDYPSEKLRYERDMKTVHAARASIAIAQELLDALKECCDDLEREFGSGMDTASRARITIAKAEGRE